MALLTEARDMWPQFHDNCQEPRKLVRGRPWLFYFLLNWRGCMAHFANLTSVPLALPIIQRQGNIRSAFQRMANIVEGRIYVMKGPGNGESVCILKNHTAPDSSRVTREVRRALGWNDRCGKTHAELRRDLPTAPAPFILEDTALLHQRAFAVRDL